MVKPRKATEADFTTFVIDLARVLGWRTAHFRPAKTDKGWRTPVQGDGAGFPDLILLRGNRMVVAELKAERGRLSPAQVEWLDAYAGLAYPECPGSFGDDTNAVTGNHIGVFVWRPRDVDEIREVLAR